MTYFQSRQENHTHRYFVDSGTQDELCLCGKLKGKAAPQKNKYNARKTEYNDLTYDSGKEAKYAQTLDLMKKAGQIKSWERQVPLTVEAEGKPIFTTKVDFRVTTKTGGIQWHEVKSSFTARL